MSTETGKINPLDDYVSTYRGVNIFQHIQDLTLYFTFNDLYYTGFTILYEAQAKIDELIETEPPHATPGDVEPPTPVSDPVIEIYRGVPIYQGSWSFGYGSGTGTAVYYLYFYYKGLRYTNNQSQQIYAGADLHLAIDDLLGGELPQEEGEETPTPTPIEDIDSPTPINLGWFQGVADWLWEILIWVNGGVEDAVEDIKSKISGIGTTIGEALAGLQASVSGIGTAISGLGASIITSVQDGLGGLFQKASDESLSRTQQILPDIVSHSSETKAAMDQQLTGMANEYIGKVLDSVNPDNYTQSIIPPEEAARQSMIMSGAIIAANIGIWTAHFFAESLTLGQLEAVGDLATIVVNNSGVNQIASRALMIPIEKSVLIPAEYEANKQYTPMIPNYSDLINMLVKEKISQEEFNKNFAYLGYNQEWSKRIWDAHFIPPTLTDYLTAWRRGKITEEEVDKGMIRIDLDPEFKTVFDTRKYVDPPTSMVRFMFEVGEISADQVKELIHLQGYRPEHEDIITKYITEFQSRLWRRRYLVSLAQGYEKGIYTKETLQAAVVEAEYTPEVASYIVKNADVRKEIAATKTEVSKAKLLTEGDLKKLYLRGKIDDSGIRTELLTRGYQLSDIDLLVGMLGEDRIELESGGPKRSLTETQLLQAYNYEELTRDQVLTELLLRGMSQREAEILLNTYDKKRAMG